MAGPVDLSALNGMTFQPENFGVTGGLWTAIFDPRLGRDPGTGTAYGTPVIYATKSRYPDVGNYPSTVAFTDTSYTASRIDPNGFYHSPIFGVVNLGGSRDYAIIGFGDDGRSILLEDTAIIDSPYWGTANELLRADLSNFGFLVLSLDTLTHYPDSATAPHTTTYAFGKDSAAINSFLSALCFAEGTRIETCQGAVAVEDLIEGQQVRTASGAVRPIRWIGRMLSRPHLHPRPWEVQPVRVTAHAFGPAKPAHDVWLSPGHAVFVDGVLVPVGNLVNGATIVQETVDQIRYFHVELESHDVLLAEGLPCESYLDDGNRASFANAGENAALHGRLDPKSWDDACAPLVAAGPQLTALQLRLHARAEALGWTRTEAADLQIEADGVAIAPVHAEGNRFWFLVPEAKALMLRSNHGVLAQLVPGLGDGRTLGVAVAELRIDGVAVDLDAGIFAAGFYPVERHEALGWRWTNGAAQLDRALAAPAMIEVALAMVAPSWVRPAPALRIVA